MRALTEAGTLYDPPWREYRPPPGRPPHRLDSPPPIPSHDAQATPGLQEVPNMASRKAAPAKAPKPTTQHVHQPGPATVAGRILVALRKHGANLSSEALAKATGIPRDRVSVELAGLRRRGLVKRFEGTTTGGAVEYYAVAVAQPERAASTTPAPVSAETAARDPIALDPIQSAMAPDPIQSAFARMRARLAASPARAELKDRERCVDTLRQLAEIVAEFIGETSVIADDLLAIAAYLQQEAA